MDGKLFDHVQEFNAAFERVMERVKELYSKNPTRKWKRERDIEDDKVDLRTIHKHMKCMEGDLQNLTNYVTFEIKPNPRTHVITRRDRASESGMRFTKPEPMPPDCEMDWMQDVYYYYDDDDPYPSEVKRWRRMKKRDIVRGGDDGDGDDDADADNKEE